MTTSAEQAFEGKRCARIERQPGNHYGEAYGSLRQTISATPYLGKRLRLKAAVRACVPSDGGQAQLWMAIQRKGVGPGTTAFRDTMADRPITSCEWQPYVLAAEVPPDAERIVYGLALVGDGQAWLDSVSLETE